MREGRRPVPGGQCKLFTLQIRHRRAAVYPAKDRRSAGNDTISERIGEGLVLDLIGKFRAAEQDISAEEGPQFAFAGLTSAD
jgi:hypothetical protein